MEVVNKVKTFFSIVILLSVVSLIGLWVYKVVALDLEKVEKFSVICDMYMLTKDGEIKKHVYTNDDWSSKGNITGSDGKVYNLAKFHYYRCSNIRPQEAKPPITTKTDIENLE